MQKISIRQCRENSNRHEELEDNDKEDKMSLNIELQENEAKVEKT